jgi:hypothetical protein
MALQEVEVEVDARPEVDAGQEVELEVDGGPEVNSVQELEVDRGQGLEVNGRQEVEVDGELGVDGGWVTSMRWAAYASSHAGTPADIKCIAYKKGIWDVCD